jgi:hypothetical protein
VPVRAVELAADIHRLEVVLSLLKQIDHTNVSKSDTQEERDFARDMLGSQTSLVYGFLRYARRKMAKEYLAP